MPSSWSSTDSGQAAVSLEPQVACVTDGPERAQRRLCAPTRVKACRIEGCHRALSSPYSQLHRICATHHSALRIEVDGDVLRYCQQCARLHSLDSFPPDARSCHTSLERRRQSKKRRAQEQPSQPQKQHRQPQPQPQQQTAKQQQPAIRQQQPAVKLEHPAAKLHKESSVLQAMRPRRSASSRDSSAMFNLLAREASGQFMDAESQTGQPAIHRAAAADATATSWQPHARPPTPAPAHPAPLLSTHAVALARHHLPQHHPNPSLFCSWDLPSVPAGAQSPPAPTATASAQLQPQMHHGLLGNSRVPTSAALAASVASTAPYGHQSRGQPAASVRLSAQAPWLTMVTGDRLLPPSAASAALPLKLPTAAALAQQLDWEDIEMWDQVFNGPSDYELLLISRELGLPSPTIAAFM